MLSLRWLLLLLVYCMCFGAVSYFQLSINYGNSPDDMPARPGIITPKVFCGNFSCWNETLRKIADNNSLIIVYAASIEYLDLTLNFFCNLKQLHIESNSILVAMDDKMYDIAKEIGIQVLFDASFSDSDDQSNNSCGNFRSSCFTKRTHLKTFIVVTLLHSGHHILFSDVDVIWLRDPRENMWNISTPGKLIIQSDDPISVSSPAKMTNSGFFLARSDHATLTTFENILSVSQHSNLTQQVFFDAILCGGFVNKGRRMKFPCNEAVCGQQTNHTRCERIVADTHQQQNSFTLITQTLSRDDFPNGRWQFIFSSDDVRRSFPNAYVIHNNWIMGLDTKVSRLRAQGLWYVDTRTQRKCVRNPPVVVSFFLHFNTLLAYKFTHTHATTHTNMRTLKNTRALVCGCAYTEEMSSKPPVMVRLHFNIYIRTHTPHTHTHVLTKDTHTIHIIGLGDSIRK